MGRFVACVATVWCLVVSALGQGLQLVPQVGTITRAAFSSDGKRIVTCGNGVVGNFEGKLAQIWDVRTGRLTLNLIGHLATVRSAAFSFNGTRVVTASDDNTARVWDARDGRSLLTLVGQKGAIRIWSAAFSHDGSRVVTASNDGTVCIWDAESGKSLFAWNEPGVDAAAFSQDGARIVTASTSNTARVWDARSGKPLRDLVGHTGPVLSAEFSREGTRIVTGSLDGTARVWDASDGHPLQVLRGEAAAGQPSAVHSAAFSPDGTRVVVVSDAARLWDVKTGKPLQDGMGHPLLGNQRVAGVDLGNVTSAAYSYDGLRIVTAKDDGVAQVWDAQTCKPLLVLKGHAGAVQSAAISADGQIVVASPWLQAVRVWDAGGGRPPLVLDHRNQGTVESAAFSRDGAWIVTASSDIHVWDAHSGDLLLTVKGPNPSVNFSSVAFSRDGTRIVSTSADGAVRIWDARDGRQISALNAGASSASLSPNGQRLVTPSAGGACVWDAQNGSRLLSLKLDGGWPPNMITSVAFSSDGKRIVTASIWDNTTRVWDADDGHPLFVLAGHGGPVNSAAFSADDAKIVTASYDRTARVWDARDGHLLLTLSGHTQSVLSAAFSIDDRRIVTASEDGTSKLWDASTGKELCSVISFDDGSWAVADPEGRFDVSSLEDDVWLSWVASDAPFTPLPIEIFTRDYYEPGLLAKIWRSEKLPSVPSLLSLDRAQPEVTAETATQPDWLPGPPELPVTPNIKVAMTVRGDEAAVTVTAAKGTAELERDGKKLVQTGLPQDVRLFLDGKLVAYEDGPVELDAQRRWMKTYHVPLPHNGEKTVEVSAYCFNQDRVKSDTVRQTLKLNLPKRIGKAYVICVGVDQYARKDLSLSYSAADATTVSETLKARLKGYAEVVAVPLLSDGAHHDATKAKFHAVLDALAGRKADLTGVPNGDKLAKSTPEDLVIVSWSGHGLASKAGRFYLLPENVRDDPDTFGKPFLDSCVSTDDLTDWLRDVRAADMALIVDACHSAAAVQSEEFKPGPLGNRGLGQLAYDKGIRVLAATQAENVALESDRLGNGLLTYALVHDGLGEGKAPSLKAWLAGAVDDVPRLYEALEKGTLRAAKGARAVPVTEGAGPQREFRQRPALFDYTRRESPVPFVAARP